MQNGLSYHTPCRWDRNLAIHTIHQSDVSPACMAVAKWMATTGRAKADELAGESVTSGLDASSPFAGKGEVLPRDKTIKVPLFNIVDKGETTQGLIADLTSRVIGVKTSFLNPIMSGIAKVRLCVKDVVVFMEYLHICGARR